VGQDGDVDGKSETEDWIDCFCVWEGILVRMAATHNDRRALSTAYYSRTQADTLCMRVHVSLDCTIPSHPHPPNTVHLQCFKNSLLIAATSPLPSQTD
jgi:hypothetical protein